MSENAYNPRPLLGVGFHDEVTFIFVLGQSWGAGEPFSASVARSWRKVVKKGTSSLDLAGVLMDLVPLQSCASPSCSRDLGVCAAWFSRVASESDKLCNDPETQAAAPGRNTQYSCRGGDLTTGGPTSPSLRSSRMIPARPLQPASLETPDTEHLMHCV